ncbi:hypothetical protein L323_19665 [Ruminiclostridium papyrosolvens C7]|uniref:Uncharacterized protein n=1 Tax=Ruminiclostridium papyrosolvens C7 TaxID=1330534 RepID=U4QWQ7_9FIRM|nr:hypothetical protein L323_19665 [Ruminiclostridium papyrosolvens C7]
MKKFNNISIKHKTNIETISKGFEKTNKQIEAIIIILILNTMLRKAITLKRLFTNIHFIGLKIFDMKRTEQPANIADIFK